MSKTAVKDGLAAQVLDLISGSPADLSQRLKVASTRWGALIKACNITI